MTSKFTFRKQNIVLQYQTRTNLFSSFEVFLSHQPFSSNSFHATSTQKFYVCRFCHQRSQITSADIYIYDGKPLSLHTVVIKVKLEGYFHFHCCILGFILTHSLVYNALFRRLRKTLPDHCSVLRTEVLEQNSPPSNLDLSVYVLSYHFMAMTPTLKENKKRSRAARMLKNLMIERLLKVTQQTTFFPPGNMTIISADLRC